MEIRCASDCWQGYSRTLTRGRSAGYREARFRILPFDKITGSFDMVEEPYFFLDKMNPREIPPRWRRADADQVVKAADRYGKPIDVSRFLRGCTVNAGLIGR